MKSQIEAAKEEEEEENQSLTAHAFHSSDRPSRLLSSQTPDRADLIWDRALSCLAWPDLTRRPRQSTKRTAVVNRTFKLNEDYQT